MADYRNVDTTKAVHITRGVYALTGIRLRCEDDTDTSPRDYDCYSDDYVQSFDDGEWGYVGIWAEVTVGVKTFGDSYLMIPVQSGGLWGVESNGGDDYLREVAKDEMQALLDTLKTLTGEDWSEKVQADDVLRGRFGTVTI